MLFATLDEITTRALLDAKVPFAHYYLEYLSHAAACLRELSFDSLKIVNTRLLPVNQSYFAIDLPDDFVDDVGVSIPIGQYLNPIPKRGNITPLRVIDPNTGQYTTHSNVSTQPESITGLFFNPSWVWFWNVNNFGETTGRNFGGDGGSTLNSYRVVKERRQIQLSETFTSDSAVLTYISDGQSADNATQIDVTAFSTIQAYIMWKVSNNANFKDSPEARTFNAEKRKLRARTNDLTIPDLKNILYSAYSATLKN